MVGQTLDRYVIEAKPGEGGMGVVYKARDTHLDRVVAIKVLPADKVADHTRKQRFVPRAAAGRAGAGLAAQRSGSRMPTHRSTTVASNIGSVDVGLDASPDGRSILFSRIDSSVNDLMLVEDFR